MVNFADSITKVTYGGLRTTTPNSNSVKKLLKNVASGVPSYNIMHEMNAKPTQKSKFTRIINLLTNFQNSKKNVMHEGILGDLSKILG